MKTILTVSTLIIDNNKILLCLKKEGKIRDKGEIKIIRDIWVYQGGAVKNKETTQDAAIREAYEEAGIKISINKLLEVEESVEDDIHWLNFVYLAHPINNQEPTILEKDVFSNAKYFDLSELPDNIHPAVIRFIRKYINSKSYE